NISRAFDKIRRRELLDNSGRGNCLVAIEDHGDSEGRFEKGNDLVPRPTGAESDICFDTTGGTGLASIKVTENGPLRASIELVKRYQSSTFTQRITMHASIPRIDFDLDIDWHDVHRMIKVAFPLQLANPIVTYHTAYGTISRPADSNEYPAQYWVDLSTKDLGIALLNNTRYAHDARGSTLRMSILRSPTEPANNNEEGKHSMRYSIFPHGDWKNSGVMRKGYEFNHPLLARATDQHVGNAPPEQSFFTIDASNVIVEVVKKAFDFDALVVRMFEFEGKATAASITGSFLTTGVASETDLLERPIKEIPIEHGKIVLEFSPFEIKTIIIS
nr:glycoside hydrolase family 38 C-terminal domain-containing protein [Candidatus Sigynarchaeota archaeon]